METDISGDQPTSQQSCKKIIDENTKQAIFAHVTYRPSPYGEVEEGEYDVVLTDGAQTWVAEGVGSSVLKPSTPNRVRHSLEALTDLFPPSESYTYELNYDVDDPPELWAKWTSRHGKGLTLTVRLPLRPAEHSGRHVSAMLDALLSNLHSLRSSAGRLEAQCRDWQAAAERAQGVVEEYVAQRAQQERDMSQKVAALLNSKKRRLREMQRELVELRARAGALPSTSAEQATRPEASAPGSRLMSPEEESVGGQPMALDAQVAGRGAQAGGSPRAVDVEEEWEGSDQEPPGHPDLLESPVRE